MSPTPHTTHTHHRHRHHPRRARPTCIHHITRLHANTRSPRLTGCTHPHYYTHIHAHAHTRHHRAHTLCPPDRARPFRPHNTLATTTHAPTRHAAPSPTAQSHQYIPARVLAMIPPPRNPYDRRAATPLRDHPHPDIRANRPTHRPTCPLTHRRLWRYASARASGRWP